ncbi:MAG: TRAM domain-containing protein [Planctomycetota bacterium]
MTLQVLRGLFILVMAAVGWFFLTQDATSLNPYLDGRAWMLLSVTLIVGVVVVVADILSPRRKLQVFAGVFFGLLIGLILAYAFSFVVPFLIDRFFASPNAAARQPLIDFINLLIGVVCCYFAISFILQTRDDFRFIIPYVEFRKDTRGTSPVVIDTSALVDGRIVGLAEAGMFESRLIVPRFVLRELQRMADEGDRPKRAKGRRGLDVLEELRESKLPNLEVVIYDPHGHGGGIGRDDGAGLDVDHRLVGLAKDLHARVLSTDFNLHKVAQVQGVTVVNLNALANALRAEVLPGEAINVHVVRPGEQPRQGVGYLADGTMVVIENAGDRIGEDVSVNITNTRQTSAGKMLFAKLEGAPSIDRSADSAMGEVIDMSEPEPSTRRRPVGSSASV